MTFRPFVKPSIFSMALLALFSSCASRTPNAPEPVTQTSSGNTAVSSPPDAGTPPSPILRTQILTPPTATEIEALRPLLARGPVFVVRNPDGGAAARITILARSSASVAQIRRVVTTPAEYTAFMPILRDVEMLSVRGERQAFRFHVAASLFDVTALCALHDVSERRIDVVVTQSETGPGASRWDLQPDGTGSLVSLTTWGDPSQGHWLLRQIARRSPSAIAGMNISTDTVLALGTLRRAEIQSGAHLPMRPEHGEAPSGPLAPPPSGPWLQLTRETTVLSLGLTPEGSVTQVTVAAWTPADRDSVIARLRDVEHYNHVWGSIREVHVLPNQQARSENDPVRYGLVIDTPLMHLEGEQVRRIEGDTVWHDGVSGDLAGSQHRWDVVRAPEGGSYVLFTGGSDYNRAGTITRVLMQRDPWLIAGFAGSWKIVWLRNLLRGL
jgi:hypothetical protein